MEVRDEPRRELEAVARVDEQGGLSPLWPHRTAGLNRQRLEGACRRRADGNDAASLAPGAADRVGGVRVNLEGLGLHDVRLDVLRPDRLEGPIAHMQGDGGALDTLARERLEDRWREVQARGGRGNRSLL